jgi:hypothetical protein
VSTVLLMMSRFEHFSITEPQSKGSHCSHLANTRCWIAIYLVRRSNRGCNGVAASVHRPPRLRYAFDRQRDGARSQPSHHQLQTPASYYQQLAWRRHYCIDCSSTAEHKIRYSYLAGERSRTIDYASEPLRVDVKKPDF